MKTTTIVLLSIAGIFALLALVIMGSYNNLVTLDEDVNNKWAQVETVYQRRADLIPNLVATVEGAADFEKSTFLEVTQARTAWLQANSLDKKVEAANQLEGALARLLVTVESYPQLKANQNFLALQDELANTENKIAVERKRYNDVVTSYHSTLRRFPANMVALLFSFEKRVYFEAETGAENAPAVNFS